MKYQVLARKYRPKTFTAMMGQEHVLKALTNALETERLHHAYLFTGTRGVGKTTVARVLAKALNCEQGIGASPCGTCPACSEIDEGRFVDLIEVDAASRTKVEDTRELLENVQYAPTRGRFKIYLIDEVHMLSGHSFNALLKTLEEPPPHVKFLLATTDPQKLPVTILSRCLQFNLKRLTIQQIEQQLQQILDAEQLDCEPAALKPIAIAADGSMRDALSLLDQAIGYSNGKPNLHDVEAMLGCVQRDRVFDILTALASADGASLIQQSRMLTEQGLDVTTLLAEIITMLQRVALSQQVPDAIDDSLGDQSAVEKMARLMTAEDVQLYYQIALNGRKDLPFSPHPQGGFEMILLRMLAFRPVAVGSQQVRSVEANASDVEKKTPDVEKKKPLGDKVQEQNGYFDLPPLDAYTQEQPVPPQEDPMPQQEDTFTANDLQMSDSKHVQSIATDIQAESSLGPSAAELNSPLEKNRPHPEKNLHKKISAKEPQAVPCEPAQTRELANDWHELIKRCNMSGLEQQLAKHCALQGQDKDDRQIVFNLLIEAVHMHLLNDKIHQRIVEQLQELLGMTVVINISQCQAQNELLTPQRREKLEAEARQQDAVDSILNDPKVALITDAYDAKVIEKTIKPV